MDRPGETRLGQHRTDREPWRHNRQEESEQNVMPTLLSGACNSRP
jgi:hypothetical protein